MSGQHLALQLIQLKSGETRSIACEGLLFLVPRCGEGMCAMGLVKERLSPGELVVVANSSITNIAGDSAEGLQAGWFSVRLEHLYPLFGSAEIVLLHRLARDFQSPRRYSISQFLSKECQRSLAATPSTGSIVHRTQLLGVVAAVLMPEFDRIRDQAPPLVPMDGGFSRCLEGLSIDDLQNLGVDQLAAKFCCGRRHLNRLFQKHLGISVAGLRKEARLLKAFCLLRDPEAKVMSVAEDCGFNHLGLFNASFRKRFGASPGQVRKQMVRTEALADAAGSDGTHATRPNRTNPKDGNRPASARSWQGNGDGKRKGNGNGNGARSLRASASPAPLRNDSRVCASDRAETAVAGLDHVAQATVEWLNRKASELVRTVDAASARRTPH